MELSDKGFWEIVGHESIVTSPYRDSVGVWTWGIGHTAAAGSPNPTLLPRGEAMPLQQILQVFRHDLKKYEQLVSKAVKVPIKQHEYDALVSFVFNTGDNSNSIFDNLNAGRRAEAALAFDKWHKPASIIGRRNAEKALFAQAKYSNPPFVTVYPANKQGVVLWSKGKRLSKMAVLGAGTVEPPTPPAVGMAHGDNLLRSRTVQGAGAAGAGGAGVLADSVNDIVNGGPQPDLVVSMPLPPEGLPHTGVQTTVDTLTEVTSTIETAQWHLTAGNIIGTVLGVLIVLGAVLTIYARWDDAGRPVPWRRKHELSTTPTV